MNLKIGISKIFTIFYVFILFSLVVLYSLSLGARQNVAFSTIVLSIDLFALLLFVVQREPVSNLKSQYIRIVPLFLFAYTIVFFQLHLDYILGNFDESHGRYWVNSGIVPQSLAISSIGFVAFILGYNLQMERKSKKIKANKYRYVKSISGYNFLSFFFLVTMIFTINPLYLFGGYGIFEMGTIARYASILFELSITGSLVQHIINLSLEKRNAISIPNYVKSLGIIRISLLLIYFVMVIISGDRGPIIYMVLSIGSSYIILTKWRISIVKFLSLLFMASLLISGLVVIRNNDNKKTPLYVQVYDAIMDDHKASRSLEDVQSVSNSTLELATSLRTLHNAVQNIPAEHPYFYGKIQALQLITVIPFGQNVLSSIFNMKDYELTSAKYVTYLVGGEDGSEGSSCVADFYLDFGMLGVLFGLLIFGYYVRYLEFYAFQDQLPSLYVLVGFIIFCQYAIYIPRSTVMFNVRNIIWVVMMIKLVNLFSKNNKIVNEVNN